jgi:ATP-dependent RNA helicase RhlE
MVHQSSSQTVFPAASSVGLVTFADLKVHPTLLAILQQHNISLPTPIQQQSIPAVHSGQDVVGIAQTGTGKTLAFVLPLFERMLKNRTPGRALVVVPTRELAQQAHKVCLWFNRAVRVNASVIVGGESMFRQVQELRQKPAAIIATPGRLLDHVRQKNVDLSNVDYFVLDEADRMFDMGFAPQIRQIAATLPPADRRQTLLFSATMPDEIAKLAANYMRTPVRIEVAPAGQTAKDVQQEMIIIDAAHKIQALFTLLPEIKQTTLIFTQTKHKASKIVRQMRDKGYRAEELHSNRSQAQRKKAIAAMQNKHSQFLVATDIAGRGIDIPHIGVVINYDLPEVAEDYVHRIGRTGRAGRSGKAISFVASDQAQQLRRIKRLINAEIKQIEIAGIQTAQLVEGAVTGGSWGGRGGRGGRRGGFGGGQRRGPGVWKSRRPRTYPGSRNAV